MLFLDVGLGRIARVGVGDSIAVVDLAFFGVECCDVYSRLLNFEEVSVLFYVFITHI